MTAREVRPMTLGPAEERPLSMGPLDPPDAKLRREVGEELALLRTQVTEALRAEHTERIKHLAVHGQAVQDTLTSVQDQVSTALLDTHEQVMAVVRAALPVGPAPRDGEHWETIYQAKGGDGVWHDLGRDAATSARLAITAHQQGLPLQSYKRTRPQPVEVPSA